MITLRGKYNDIIIYADKMDSGSNGFLTALCSSPTSENSKIRVMPDVHAGKGCVIGLTMTIADKVVPNFVGVDIGCGVTAVRFKSKKKLDFNKLDKFIYEKIPHGPTIREDEHPFAKQANLDKLRCYKHIQADKAMKSVSTLGGGNHFIEVDQDSNGDYWLLVHTGSRHLGFEVATWYQDEAFKYCSDEVPYELAYTSGQLMIDYLHDITITQQFANLNRRSIAMDILKEMKLDAWVVIDTVHNYIDTASMILRKGAVSAVMGEPLVIPMSMKEGCLLCKGKGNLEWNFSAPHGAGRLMSRKDARNSFTLTEYKKQMEGIFTTSVSRKTIDESPMAYKPMEDIVSQISDTVEIVDMLKPLYNFKSKR